MSLADLDVGSKQGHEQTLVALLIQPWEKVHVRYLNLIAPHCKFRIYAGRARPNLKSLSRNFPLIVSTRVDTLQELVDDPSIHNYQGSTFNFRKARILIIESIKSAMYDMKYCVRTQQYILKLTQPYRFPPQEQLQWQALEKPSREQRAKALSSAEASIAIAVDIETIPHHLGETTVITMVGFTCIAKDLSTFTYVVPLNSKTNYDLIDTLLRTPAPKIMHGGRYDCTVLLKWRLAPVNYIFDTMVMIHSWLHDLPKTLAATAAFCTRDSRYWKEGRKATEFYDKMLYNARDCEYTALSFLFMLVQAPKWTHQAWDYKHRRNLYAIKYGFRGMNTSPDKLKQLLDKAEPARAEKLRRLQTIIGNPDFNPNSPPQSKALFTILARKRMAVPNADDKLMNKIKELDSFCLIVVTLMQEYREASKLIGTYLEAKLTANNRLLYGLNVLGTTSDRWASNTSDLWAEPEVGKSGKLLAKSKSLGQAVMVFTRTKDDDYWLPSARAFIVADEGMILGSCDLPQSESRFTAYLSQDANLISAVESPLDFHKTNASSFFGVPYDEVGKDLRQLAKPVNHGANYNMGAFILIETMGVKQVLKARTLLGLNKNLSVFSVAQILLDSFMEAYPRIKGSAAIPRSESWYGELLHEVLTTAKLQTPWGFTKLVLGDPARHKPTLNTCVSTKPQNMSAEYLHRALDYLEANHTQEGVFEILAPIHDEILFQCQPAMMQQVSEWIVDAMTQSYTLNGRTFTIQPDPPCFGDDWSLIH